MKRAYILIFLAILAVVPWFVNNRYIYHIATMIVIMAPMAMTLSLMMRIGQLSIAHPAFMGIGAYASALLTMRLGFPPILSLFAGGLMASLMALALGPIFLRIKGVYFVLLTYAFGEIINLIFQEWTSLFGGNSGLYGIPKFSLFGFRLTAVHQYYVMGLLFTAATYALVRAIDKSDIGAILKSLNDDEMLSRSLGGNALSWRIFVFAFGAFIAALAGGIYAFYIGFLSPDPFGFKASVDLIVINAIGGTSAVLGPLLGAIAIVPLPELLRDVRQFQLLIYGLCLIIFLMFYKDGILSILDRKVQR